ncbi:MAG: sulfatase-like hydrolase/transferase [Pseudomonadota bacterium]
MSKPNVLLITLDQLWAGALTGALGAAGSTPNLDRLASSSAVFRNHYSVTVPCGPARASLLTGLYAMNHRAIRNGTPLASHHATLATEARKSGFEPLLFGYCDVPADPTTRDPEDPDLSIYEGVAPGFRELVEMRMEEGLEWPAYLRAKGYDFTHSYKDGLPSHQRPISGAGRNKPRPSDPAPYAAEHSDTAYLTDKTLEALDIRRDTGWFAHLTYIRPHPPLIAPDPWNRLVGASDVTEPNRSRPGHPYLDAWFSGPSNRGLFWGFDGNCDGMATETAKELRAVYLGLIAEVDHHLGRVIDWLERTGQDRDTLLILTSDHGEMLGEKGMWGKDSVFAPAYHVPLMIRDPRRPGGRAITAMTESVDVTPTILDWIGRTVPEAMDGRSLLPLLEGSAPDDWRDWALMEADFGHPQTPSRIQRHLGFAPDDCGVMMLRSADWSYIHFAGDLPPMLFDLSTDPDETVNLAQDPSHADQVAWCRGQLLDRTIRRRDRRLTEYSIGA